VFDFAHLENFPAIGGFPGAENRKNEAVFFMIFSKWSGTKFFMLRKLSEKSSGVLFLSVG
jgi:hypothetical protein